MCGHDGHMATMLAVAEVIHGNREKIPRDKRVRIVFQPAEEEPGGAVPMIREGCLHGVDEIYAFHNLPNVREGEIRVVSGPIMAKITVLKIKVVGKGGHGSLPHLVRDVISAGSAIVGNLHTIKATAIRPSEYFTLAVTQFTSGHCYNVFPDEAFLQGGIRSYNEDILT